MRFGLPRRQMFVRPSVVILTFLTVITVACAGGDDDPLPNDQAGPDEIFLFVNFTDVAPGENRLAYALRRPDGGKVDVAPEDVLLTYEKRDSGISQTAPEATFREWPLGGGVFTTTANYDSAGLWDFNVTVKNPDGSATSASATRLVKDVASTPAIGSPAPAVATKTGATPEELAFITSDANPIPELYAVSFDEALASNTPIVVTFSTPAWCTSQTCGPQVVTVDEVRQNHVDDAAFIHVELFDNPEEMRQTGDPQVGVLTPAAEPWNLPSEPWTFVIDSDGLIAAKFEAFTTAQEIEDALALVLDG